MKTTTLLPIAALLLTNFSSHAALLHHWAFDETTGDAAVDSVGSNGGTWQDPGANLTWESDMVGNAAHLNNAGGEAQYFDVGVLSSLAGATSSVSLWFYADGGTSYHGLLASRSESNAGSWAVAWEAGNRVDLHTSGDNNQTDSESTLSAGNWYHVLAVWDNDTGNRSVFINGDPAGTGASVTGIFTGGSAFVGDGTWRIGNDPCCGDRDFDGLIDDLAVFDTALTAADAATIYNAGLVGTSVALALSPASDVDDDGLDDPWEDKHFGDGDGTATTAELALQDGDDGYPIADGDGLDNAGEQAAGTDPNVADSDTDGINDGDEVSGAQNPYKVGHTQDEPPGGTPGEPTNPRDDDSDGDTILDGEELTAGADGFVTNPNDGDTDGDLMGDLYEITNNLGDGLDPIDASDDVADLDGDTLDNIDEHNAIPQTRADKADTDDDGYDDPVEDLFGSWGSDATTGTDPTNPDSDGDGLLDGQENPDLAAHNPPSQYKTDPNIFDSDTDGSGDGEEVAAGSDPDDENSTPPPPPGVVLRVDFENSIDPGGGLSPGDVATQAGWTAMIVSNAPDPTVSMLSKQHTLTVWHNVSATDSQSFATGLYAITPSVATGTLLGTPTNGQATNWTRNTDPLATDAEFLNSVISFTSSGGTAEILLTSASQSLVMSGLLLEFPVASTGGLVITGSGFDGSDTFYIEITGDADALAVSRAYALQRYVTACAGRGAFPIKFNGSIFNVEKVRSIAGIPAGYDADYRRWGGPYWWQNTRLAYWPMLVAGDFEMMRPLFQMYAANLDIARERTRRYYGHGGAFFPETQYFCGTYTDDNYGRDRTGKPNGFTDNTYIRQYWSSGLELSMMMLDYHAHTGDKAFAADTLVPVVGEILRFFDEHWPRVDGKIRFDPAMSLETWHKAVNPLPEIVGIRAVATRMLTLDESLTTPDQRTGWKRLLVELPPVPIRETNIGPVLAPAESFSNKKNSENPELYAVFPHRAYGLGQPDLDLAVRTYKARGVKGTGGWRQDAIKAAMLGLTDAAKSYVVSNAKSKHPGFRFPTMWGPNFDWLPDQDHGSVTMIALQKMLMQAEGDAIRLLPAWPDGWDVRFKLRSPGGRTIEAVYKDRRLVSIDGRPVDFAPKTKP